MKKFLYILLGVLLAGVIIISCKKEQPPVVVVPTYTITVTKTGNGSVVPDRVTGVPLGDSRTIVATAETDWAVYSAKSNSTTYDVPFLSTSYSFSITNINADQNAVVVFVKKSDLWVSKDKWYLWISELQFGDNEPWYIQNLSPAQYTDYMIFTLDGKLSRYHSNGVIFGGPFDYKILGETLTNVQGIVYTIKRLDDIMILESDMPSSSGHIHARETFKHTPKPL